jgi:hypothetical protein
MRISNVGTTKLTFTDLDRGLDYQAGVYEFTNAKGPSSVEADEFIHVFDSDRTLLSAELGQVAKMKNAELIETQYSLVAKPSVSTISIVEGENDELVLSVDGNEETYTLDEDDYTLGELVSAINDSASGFFVEEFNGGIAFVSDDIIVIGDGSLNSDLGLLEGMKTTAK